ncbi:MAG: lactonase family protein [Bifidobacteriaceae bacterium]|jgi:hypothetical protein|nr:lactonase family protein [Bifidobacteriaceae bacterium]
MGAESWLVATYGPQGGISLVGSDAAGAAAANAVVGGGPASGLAVPDCCCLAPGIVPGVFHGVAGNEHRPGVLVTFQVKHDGVRLVNETPSGGSEPCHLAVIGEGAAATLAVANYSSGTVAFFPLGADGYPQAPSDVIALPSGGKGLVPRQDAPHPHFVARWPGDRGSAATLVVDLGSDQIWRVSGRGGQRQVSRFASLAPGTGPRHLAILGESMAVSGELSGQIAFGGPDAWNYGSATGVIGSGPVYPGDLRALGTDRVAVANRGRGSVAVLKCDQHAPPELIHEWVMPGSWPQQLWERDGRLLVVDRDGGRIVCCDPVSGGQWPIVSGLASPMWALPLRPAGERDMT